MISIRSFTFNPFQENTYVLHDETRECVIIDPGMSDSSEEQILLDYIESNDLVPVRLMNTHCHIDHILGNALLMEKFGLKLYLNRGELPILQRGEQSAMMFGVNFQPSPPDYKYLEEGDMEYFGSSSLKVLFVPGHSPGHIAFYSEKDGFVIGGDVLFRGSVGRVDLPGAEPAALVRSIQQVMYRLPVKLRFIPAMDLQLQSGKKNQQIIL